MDGRIAIVGYGLGQKVVLVLFATALSSITRKIYGMPYGGRQRVGRGHCIGHTKIKNHLLISNEHERC